MKWNFILSNNYLYFTFKLFGFSLLIICKPSYSKIAKFIYFLFQSERLSSSFMLCSETYLKLFIIIFPLNNFFYFKLLGPGRFLEEKICTLFFFLQICWNSFQMILRFKKKIRKRTCFCVCFRTLCTYGSFGANFSATFWERGVWSAYAQVVYR